MSKLTTAVQMCDFVSNPGKSGARMLARLALLLATLGALSLAACTDDVITGSTESPDADAAAQDISVSDDTGATDVQIAQDATPAEEVADDVQADLAEDATDSDAKGPCPVGLACPCSADSDCASGQCTIDSSGSGTCALPCDNGKCPDGQICQPAKGDPSKSVCVAKPPCEPKTEVCNGQDDDCDGQTDEGLCYDGNPCTDDLCSADGSCTHPNNSAPCDDGNTCTGGDLCQSGACTPGTAAGCDDGKVCTKDSCNQTDGTCAHANLDGGCEDGSACTLGDTCTEGECLPGAALTCDDQNLCTDDACDPAKGCVNLPNTVTCSDGDACTGPDVCAMGACTTTKVNCDDGTPCTADSCDNGSCVHLAQDATCDDANPCTEADLCNKGACSGTAKDCDDNSPCTIDACEGGTCSHKQVADDSTCDDGNPCTEKDVCNHDGICGGKPRVCDDNNPCTTDACQKTDGACQFEPTQGQTCEDGNACTLGDACIAGACVSGAVKACGDGLVCTSDSCDPTSGNCAFVPADGSCDDNNPCTLGDTCQGGACQSGPTKDCDDKDPCTIESCDPSNGNCKSAAAVDGISCEDGKACTQGDACLSGKCAAGKVPQCDDGNPCTDEACDPQTGKCVAKNADGKGCSDGNNCTANDTCQSGSCVSGTVVCACQSNADCTSKEDGDLCNGTLYCELTTHTCEINKKTVVVCDTSADTACLNWSCTPSKGKCEPKNKPDLTECDADSSICTKGDACLAGLCAPGALVGCDDGNPCTNDTCDPVGGCTHTNNNVTCNDNSACTQTDVCSGGSCVGTLPKNCDDANACTADSCEASTGNCLGDFLTGPGCDDGNPCTLTDTCAAGVCTPKSNVTCNDGKTCTFDVCDSKTGKCAYNAVPDQIACEDGNLCTLADNCQKGVCTPGKTLACNDNSPCTNDSCDITTGKCSYVNANEGGACTDGDACTVGDLCKAGACISGATKDCNTGNPCVLDKCDQQTGKCVAKVGTLPCDDGNACSEGDACDNGTCKPQVVIFCDDGNACTTDSCDTTNGKCVYAANSAPCSDGTACTSGDICSKGACIGTPTVCTDSNPCTTEYCDPLSGCKYPATVDGSPCSDGSVCTSGDACAAGKCKGVGIVCSDGNPCTTDTCDPLVGCKFVAFSGACSDGNPCTTGDNCSSGKCLAGAPVACNDGSACTDDACDPSSGACKYTANDKNSCNDSNACTTGDYCGGGTCKPGITVVDCDDKNTCTSDWCDPGKGCQHKANPAVPCDDSNPCTLKDICQSGVCQSGTWDLCDDNNACTSDLCDTKQGCLHNANTNKCDDGNACLGPDACVSGKCVGASPTGCNDSNVCTTDSCDTKTGCIFTPVANGTTNTTSFASGTGTLVSDTLVTNPDGSQSYSNFVAAPATWVAPFWSTIQGASWVWITPTTTDPTKLHMCQFKQTFNVATLSNVTATLTVAADNSLLCQINGKTVVASVTNNNYSVPKVIAIKQALAIGSNTMVCTVENFGFPDGTPSTNPGGLAFRIDLSNVFGGAACDDGNSCTSTDVCYGGQCTGIVGQLCDDGNACTLDTCDTVKGCSNTQKDGLPCDDGNQCTSKDGCLAGKCAGGPATSCDDGNLCTTDKCDKFTGCVFSSASTGQATNVIVTSDATTSVIKADGSTAPAALAWTGFADWTAAVNASWIWATPKVVNAEVAETTQFQKTFDVPATAATVVGTVELAADGAWICEVNGKLVGVETAENTYQTPLKISLAGKLVPGSNTWACTVTNPGKTGSTPENNPAGLVYRLNIQAYAQGGAAPCDDGNSCTAGDWCLGPFCNAGAPLDCNDDNNCTVDFCDPKTGCGHNVSGATACNDGNPCTVSDACAGAKCVGGPAANCSDNNPCTNDTCTATGGCANTNADGASCNDANPCTDKDTCQGGKCGSNVANSCDDGIACTTDACTPSQGCYHNVANSGACDDGNTCTINDVCSGGQCLGSAQNSCDDGNACTTDSCDGVKGCTSVAVVSGPCEDGNPCTLSDGCKGATCAGGTAKPCNDSEPCTVDSCDQKTGACVFAPMADASQCEDGNLCTAGDKCLSGKCKSGALRSCSDGNPCTDDACDPTSGNCSNAVLVGVYVCDDGDPCTLGDTCTKGACGGKAKDCNDNNACTIDACNSGSGSCFYKAVTPCTP